MTERTHRRYYIKVREEGVSFKSVIIRSLAVLITLTINRYKLVAMKLVTPSKEHLEKHYEDLSDKPFYKGLVTCAYMSSRLDQLPLKYVLMWR